MYDLSIVIPARNEMFLARTVEDLLENTGERTEIIVVLDGAWSDPALPRHKRLTVLYYPKSIGQRASSNQAVRLSKAKYVAKTDAHCAFDKGFDQILMDDIQDDWTMVPIMKNLHVFDWVCEQCGYSRYQGRIPTECPDCSNTTKFKRDIKWRPKPSPNSVSYRFDNTLHFQYWKGYSKREEARGDLNDTMSIQGSFFMLTREKWWSLDICDERHGSWGQQGTEVACKTWLSGGRVVCSKKTWYAHLFRTQGGDFGFPYPNPGITKARKYSRKFWFSDLEELKEKWPPAKHDLKWLLNKFDPVPGWDTTSGIVYYSCNTADEKIMEKCRKQLKKASDGRRIVSVTLKPIDFGNNIHLDLTRGYLTMAKQILAGLKEHNSDIIFFCEHDVLYHPSHFDFIPTKDDIYYYNTNVWKVRPEDGHAMRTADMKQLSGLCAYRKLLLPHFEKRVKILEQKVKELGEGSEFNRYVRQMSFEPGTHGRAERVDDYGAMAWESKKPNVDIRHGDTLTPSRWSPEQFRNKKFTKGWKETKDIPGWGSFKHFWPRI